MPNANGKDDLACKLGISNAPSVAVNPSASPVGSIARKKESGDIYPPPTNRVFGAARTCALFASASLNGTAMAIGLAQRGVKWGVATESAEATERGAEFG